MFDAPNRDDQACPWRVIATSKSSARFMLRCFGQSSVPVVYPLPIATVEGRACYLIDAFALTPAQRSQYCDQLSMRDSEIASILLARVEERRWIPLIHSIGLRPIRVTDPSYLPARPPTPSIN
jgi:hypothetical protein